MRRVCVFCGSRAGHGEWTEAADAFGRLLGRRGLGLVYGGANQGLMGAVADGALAEGAEVIGVMPGALEVSERAHTRLTTMEIVPTMHARKARMIALSDAIVALPGGLGTLDELFEAWTWSTLGIHNKPVGLLDIGGYWQPLLQFLDHATDAGLVTKQARALLFVDDTAESLLDRMGRWQPGALDPRWTHG